MYLSLSNKSRSPPSGCEDQWPGPDCWCLAPGLALWVCATKFHCPRPLFPEQAHCSWHNCSLCEQTWKPLGKLINGKGSMIFVQETQHFYLSMGLQAESQVLFLRTTNFWKKKLAVSIYWTANLSPHTSFKSSYMYKKYIITEKGVSCHGLDFKVLDWDTMSFHICSSNLQ